MLGGANKVEIGHGAWGMGHACLSRDPGRGVHQMYSCMGGGQEVSSILKEEYRTSCHCL